MRISGLCLLMILCSGLVGCVTEVNGVEQVDRNDDPNRGPSPLERAQRDVARLVDRLQFESGTQLYGTMQRIVAYREIAREPLIDALENSQTRSRANILYLLGYVGGPESRPVLVKHLGDKDEVVRYEAAAALLGLGDFSSVPILIEMLSSPDRQLRYKAHEALAKITREDFGFLAHAPETERRAAAKRWADWWTRQRARLLFDRSGGETKPAGDS